MNKCIIYINDFNSLIFLSISSNHIKMLRVARHLFGITSASNNIGGVNCITNQIRDYKKRTIKIRTRTRPKKVYNGKQLRRKEQPLEANNTYMLQRLQIMRQ